MTKVKRSPAEEDSPKIGDSSNEISQDRKKYGTDFIISDYQNLAKLGPQTQKIRTGITDELGKKGYISIDSGRIKKAEQESIDQSGKEHENKPSTSFSGHVKNKRK